MQPSLPVIDPTLALPQQLKALRIAKGRGIGELAELTGLSRLTVSAAEGRADVRISSLAAILDALGYTLMPVPRELASEVASFINNGGVTMSLPAGQTAPLGVGQRAFLAGMPDAE